MADNDIKVSVVIPVYNESDYLHPALDSVLDQTLREIEIICVDDGSTDDSLDIVKEYQKADDRIRIVTEQNAGPAWARNNGLRRARGEFVIFLDADDFFEPTLLERLYTRGCEQNLDIVLTDYDFYNCNTATFVRRIPSKHEGIYAGGAVVSKAEYPDVILDSTTGSAWNKLFRRRFLEEKNLSFLDIQVFEDVYLTTTALSMAERVGAVDGVLLHHRIYSGQSRVRMFRKHYAQVPKVYIALREFLTHHGMYPPLATSYLNLSASRCFKIYNLLWLDAKRAFYHLLQENVDDLGWRELPSEIFESEEVCDFVASVQLLPHTKYTVKRGKGILFHADWLRNRFRMVHSNRLFRRFWERLFRRNSKQNDK